MNLFSRFQWVVSFLATLFGVRTPTKSICPIPRFDGDWEATAPYPLTVSEAQGAMVQDELIIVSGFTLGTEEGATPLNFGRSLNSDTWRPLADLPIPEGITHGAFCTVEDKFYMCGGYLGGHPGPHIPTCLVYDKTQDVWSFLPDLPEGRGGGGMIYHASTNSLVFSGGAERPNTATGSADSIDYQHTWSLNLGSDSTTAARWTELPDLPYLTNHMSFVSATDHSGQLHHFFLGGQMGEDERFRNSAKNYEWDGVGWTQRQSMPFKRGHASISTRAIGCGFLIAGGSANIIARSKDISFYDIDTDSWTKMGDLPERVKTPVCDFGSDSYMYCESGLPDENYSYRRKIVV